MGWSIETVTLACGKFTSNSSLSWLLDIFTTLCAMEMRARVVGVA